MALQKEIWLDSIVEGLFADNSFLSKAVNFDQFVSNKTVHVPNAGAGSGVQKNRSSLPASVQKRIDRELTFDLDEYTTDPITIPNAEMVELSYDKRKSVISADRAALFEAIAKGMLKSWAPNNSTRLFPTSGKEVPAHSDKATGKRKALTKKDILAVMTRFNLDNVPATDRYLLLDAVMYSQLLDSLTSNESQAFLATADTARGVIGNLYGFDVMMRSEVLSYDGETPKEANTEGKATDFAAAIAWHKESVGRALGEVKMFSAEDSPTYYGDLYSFLLRCGGTIVRSDQKGVAAIVQTVAD